jgi:hypothetical protein
MAVKIQWQPPVMLEARKQAQWERIIRCELGELDDPLDVSLSFQQESLRWKVDTAAPPALGAQLTARSRERVVGALRAHGKPAV